MSYDNTNRGALFKNTDKQSENHPDYRGTIFISPELAGKEINIAAWIKESGPQSQNPGMKFMSLAVSEKRPKSAPEGQKTPETAPFDDKIPF